MSMGSRRIWLWLSAQGRRSPEAFDGPTQVEDRSEPADERPLRRSSFDVPIPKSPPLPHMPGWLWEEMGM